MTDPRDLARYLPLSSRPRVDETGVTNDWRARLEELAAALDEAEPEGIDAAVAERFERARARRTVRVADLGTA